MLWSSLQLKLFFNIKKNMKSMLKYAVEKYEDG